MNPNNKNIVSKLVALLILMTISTGLTYAQATEVEEKINTAFSTNDAEILNDCMNKTVELKLVDKVGIYNKTQAGFIIEDFFKAQPTQSFDIINTNVKGTSTYIVGKLETSKGLYQVFILLKQENNTSSIYQLSIMR